VLSHYETVLIAAGRIVHLQVSTYARNDAQALLILRKRWAGDKEANLKKNLALGGKI
jgi:hypothetical protein